MNWDIETAITHAFLIVDGNSHNGTWAFRLDTHYVMEGRISI